MAEAAKLIIRPVLSGNASATFRPLNRGLRRLKGTAHGVARTIGGITRRLTSMTTIVAGFAAYGAGRSMWDALIGSNAEMESRMVTMRTLIGDADKAAKLVSDIRDYAAATPFGEGELIEGSKRLLRLTGDNIARNQELLKLASQMAAINPSRNTTDAAEALLDASTGEFERLKEFGIKLSKKQVDDARKSGQTLGEAAMESVFAAVKKQTGGRDVVAALSGTFQGIKSTLTDELKTTFRDLGGGAFDEIKKGMKSISAALSALRANPKFQAQLVKMSDVLAEGAKWAIELVPQLIENIPNAIERIGQVFGTISDIFDKIKNFYNEHPKLVKAVAGGLAVKFGYDSLFGEEVESTGSARNMGCCCGDGKGGGGGGGAGGGGGFLSKIFNPLSTTEIGDRATSAGAVTKLIRLLGVGGSAVGVIGIGAAGLAAAGAGAAAIGTPIAAAAYDAPKAFSARAEVGKSRAFDAMLVNNWDKKIGTKLEGGDLEGIKSDISKVLGSMSKDGTLSNDRQQSMLDVFDRALSKHGLSVDLDKGQKASDLEFDNTFFSGMGETAEKLNKTEITVNVAVPAGSPASEEHANIMGDAVGKRLSEEARKSRATR